VELGPFSGFERVHAPIIKVVGGAGDIALAMPVQQSGEGVTHRMVVNKDFILQRGESLTSNVVAGRRILLQERTHVLGSLKSNATMDLEADVRVEGSTISASDLHIGRMCCLQGPVLAEGELVIESGTRIATRTQPTTVRARSIRIAPRVTIHGSLCAYEHGQVEG
jgi:cytoskeletal protein CcmA (bactofilin family)